MKSGSKKTKNCEKLGKQSNQTHAEDTNNSSRKEPALLISILHARKSCQLSLRQTAAAFHTILCTTSSGPPLYTEQGGCVLRLTVVSFIYFLPLGEDLKDLYRSLSRQIVGVKVLFAENPNNRSIMALSVGKTFCQY